MARSALAEAFDHHAWANRTLLAALAALDPARRDVSLLGTYGTVIATFEHLVSGDGFYLATLGEPEEGDADTGDVHDRLGALAELVERHARAWERVLATLGEDPDRVVTDVDEAGWRRDASVGLRCAQALQHGTEHRAQILTALTFHGLAAPDLSVWAYGDATGRVLETPPS